MQTKQNNKDTKYMKKIISASLSHQRVWQKNKITDRPRAKTWRALLVAFAASIGTFVGFGADFTVTADTPTSFRASLSGVDTDPFSLGSGNDFAQLTFAFWTVLVNLRGDGVDLDG